MIFESTLQSWYRKQREQKTIWSLQRTQEALTMMLWCGKSSATRNSVYLVTILSFSDFNLTAGRRPWKLDFIWQSHLVSLKILNSTTQVIASLCSQRSQVLKRDTDLPDNASSDTDSSLLLAYKIQDKKEGKIKALSLRYNPPQRGC